jgi:hypothetical protein
LIFVYWHWEHVILNVRYLCKHDVIKACHLLSSIFLKRLLEFTLRCQILSYLLCDGPFPKLNVSPNRMIFQNLIHVYFLISLHREIERWRQVHALHNNVDLDCWLNTLQHLLHEFAHSDEGFFLLDHEQSFNPELIHKLHEKFLSSFKPN